jgi:hypothetical protein
MTIHLWNFAPRSASLCGKALYTHRITGDPYAATCATCYLNWLLRIGKK